MPKLYPISHQLNQSLQDPGISILKNSLWLVDSIPAWLSLPFKFQNYFYVSLRTGFQIQFSSLLLLP